MTLKIRVQFSLLAFSSFKKSKFLFCNFAQKTTFGFIISVADIVASHRAFSGQFAAARHVSYLICLLWQRQLPPANIKRRRKGPRQNLMFGVLLPLRCRVKRMQTGNMTLIRLLTACIIIKVVRTPQNHQHFDDLANRQRLESFAKISAAAAAGKRSPLNTRSPIRSISFCVSDCASTAKTPCFTSSSNQKRA